MGSSFCTGAADTMSCLWQHLRYRQCILPQVRNEAARTLSQLLGFASDLCRPQEMLFALSGTSSPQLDKGISFDDYLPGHSISKAAGGASQLVLSL